MAAKGVRAAFKAPKLTLSLKPKEEQPADRRQAGSCDPWTESGAWRLPAGAGKISGTGVVVAAKDGRPSAGESPHAHLESKIKLENLKNIKLLGKGSAGQVTLAEDTVTGAKYAVKTVSFSGQQSQKMWEEETKRLWESSPYLVQTLQAFTLNVKESARERKLVLVQEYMDVGSLQVLLSLCRQHSVVIPERVISVLTRQMLHGLKHLHTHDKTRGATRAQIHRDLKPGNILLNLKGECKVADFGTTSEVATLGQSSFIGTTLYMSPERIKGGKYSTPADLWAAGVTVAEMALGNYPFNASSNFLQLLQEITSTKALNLDSASQELASFVHALMRSDPQQRPTAGDALELQFISKYADVGPDAVAEWLAKEIVPRSEAASPKKPAVSSPTKPPAAGGAGEQK